MEAALARHLCSTEPGGNTPLAHGAVDQHGRLGGGVGRGLLGLEEAWSCSYMKGATSLGVRSEVSFVLRASVRG